MRVIAQRYHRFSANRLFFNYGKVTNTDQGVFGTILVESHPKIYCSASAPLALSRKRPLKIDRTPRAIILILYGISYRMVACWYFIGILPVAYCRCGCLEHIALGLLCLSPPTTWKRSTWTNLYCIKYNISLPYSEATHPHPRTFPDTPLLSVGGPPHSQRPLLRWRAVLRRRRGKTPSRS